MRSPYSESLNSGPPAHASWLAAAMTRFWRSTSLAHWCWVVRLMALLGGGGVGRCDIDVGSRRRSSVGATGGEAEVVLQRDDPGGEHHQTNGAALAGPRIPRHEHVVVGR